MRHRASTAAAILLATWAFSCNSDNNEPTDGQDGGQQETAETDIELELVPAFGQVRFVEPTDVDPLPSIEGTYFVVEKAGIVKEINGTGEQRVVADLTARVNDEGVERGLLSLVTAVDFAASGLLYLYYSSIDGFARLSSFVFTEGEIDPGSERVLLKEPHASPQHWGGGLAFGLDGYLYLGVGDNERSRGPARASNRSAQDLSDLAGSVLRIDVESENYSVPGDNPFTGNEEGYRDEIFAYGFRNPWRLSIDRQTGEIWVADVGRLRWEEVNYDIQRGGNYGWDLKEGFACFRQDPCELPTLVDPLAVYSHGPGCAIVGGVVYRGALLPELDGSYIFADYCTGEVSAVTPAQPQPQLLLETGTQVHALAEDVDGEVLVLSAAGTIYRLVAAD